MALSDALGIQALVQSYDEKAVNQALVSLATKINKSVDDVNKDLNKIKIDKDVVNNLVNQIKALPEEVRKKTQGMSFDLFSDLINADGAEEKIDEAMKTFSNKIQSFVKLRDQIGNDELIIKADYSQIDELIGKTERLLELQKELDKWQSGKSRTKKSINADISSVESEIKSGISNLNVSGGQVGVGVNVDNEALAELDKKIKETEESLKSAREEAEKYGGSLDVLKKKIDQTYNKSIDKDTQKNADNFREAVQNYIKAGGSQKDLDKDYLSWYKLSGESWPKNFIPLNQIANESEEAQQKVQELENALDNLYRQREALSKGVGSNVISSEIDAEKLKEQEQEINKIKESLTKTESQLEQVNQKYAEQSNLVSELENKLKVLEGINNPKVIETDEYKNIISELEAAKKKASEFQNEMNELRQTVEVLKSSLSSYNTGDVVPRQDLENANRVIDNLSNKINELETSLTETKNKFALLSEEVTKLQQDKSDLSGQLAQQKEINAAQQEQISNQSKIQAELEKTKNKLNELLTTIAKLQDIQKNAISTIENYGEIEEFKKASKIVGYNEGIDTPENFVNFDYLEKAKQKVQELGKEYDKLDVKASVYYNQYLQKGGTEKIFDANGKDVSNELISLYTEMSSLINQTGDISIETAQKILRSVNSQIYSLNEEKKALEKRNKELEKSAKLEEKVAKAKEKSSQTQQTQQEQSKKQSATKPGNLSREQFVQYTMERQKRDQSQKGNIPTKDTSKVDSSSILSEQQALEKLEQAIISVTTMIGQKNLAIQAEEVQMNQSVNQEIAKLEKLKGKLNEIKTEFENGIASRLFKDTDGNDTTVLGEVTLSPKLSDTFKTDADKLLDDINIEKEVELKITGLNDSNQNIENIKKQIESATEDVNLSDSYNPNQFNELLSKDFSTKGKKEATSQLREAYNEFKQYYNDLDKLNTAEGQKAAYNYYKSYEEAINQNISKTNLERYPVANDIYNNEDLNNEIDLATRSMKLFSEVQNELGNIKIDDSIAEHVSKLTYNLREFEKVKSDLDNNVPRLESVDEVDGNLKSTYSMEATKKEYEELSDTVTYFETILKSEISYAKEFGETLTQSAQKAESAIVDVNDELNNKQKSLHINDSNGLNENPQNYQKNVDLFPDLNKTKFKQAADELLDQINLDKEVNLKFGKLDNDYSDSTANDIIDNFNIKDKEVQDKIQTLVRSLSNISINEILSGTENSNFISVLDELGQVVVKNANIISDKLGVYDEFYEYFKNLGTIKISDTIKSNLGDDWNELRKAYPQKFSTTKGIELDSIYQEMSSQFKDIFSGVADPSEQFREIINNIKLFRKDVAQSVSLTDDDINAVYQQLVSRVREMRNQIKNDLGVSIDSNEFEQNKIKLEPLLDQPSWEKEIDRILGLIGTKKIKIEPDTTSQEWNDFKAYIEKISNLTINLKNVSKSNASPQSDLNNSYTNSIKYATDLNKIEEQIAKAKESNNRQELEKLSTLEAQKKKFEELLKLEENFRANERFSGIDTSANDSELNQLRESFNQEYQKNRQTYASDLASNMDNLYDEAAGEYSKKLLQDQLNLQKEIEYTKTRIAELERYSVTSDEDEVYKNQTEQESLRQRISLLEQSSNSLQNEINQFDKYIDKQKQAIALEEVRSKAEKDRAKLTKNSVDDSNNYARVNNLLKEQEETIRQINILQTKQDNTGLTDTEQSLLNSLSEKYLSIQERVTEELNKQYEVTSRIADRREKLATNNIGLDNIRSLDFSGDINFGNSETQINRITTAIDEVNTEMQKLKSQGQTDLFANEFDKAAIKVQNLNNELLSNNITLSEYKSSIKELQSDLSKKTNAVEFFDPGNMEATMQQMKDIALQIPGIQEDTLKWGNANKTLTATLQDQNGEWKKVTISAQNAGNVITKTFTNVNAPAGTFSKFLDQLSSKFMNLGSYLVSFVGFYEIWDQIKQGVTYVKELDTALTEMKKVSDETTESLMEFQEASFDIADSVASTAKEIQNSTADWLRLGYAMEEASELARTTAVYKAVGDDMDIATATESMVSTLQGFQLEADQAANIVDQFNEVSNNFAIDSKGIGDALQRSAASFNAANTGMSESIALITATNAVLQDPEKVGI